ncbi:hypothetical protein F5B19DRAFT_480481 [Rostrohypoxylon terebratum]|nr:hypothetical protein F5B19DRAFT_480481 [Rostrohypoxylon terebratum]
MRCRKPTDSYVKNRDIALVTLRCGCHYHLRCLSLPNNQTNTTTCHNLTATYFYIQYNLEFRYVMVDISNYRPRTALPWERRQLVDPFRTLKDDVECAICQSQIDSVNVNTHSVAVDCGSLTHYHYFHAACLATAIIYEENSVNRYNPSRSVSCPYCRQPFVRVSQHTSMRTYQVRSTYHF